MPLDLAGKVRELAAEVVIRDKTGTGAQSVKASFDKVGDAAEGAAVAVERTSKVTSSAERAWSRLQSRIDPLAKASARLAADMRTLDRAYETGVVSAGQRAEAEQRLHRAFEGTERRIRETERAQAGLNRTFTLGQGLIQGLKGAAIGFVAAFSFDRIISGARDATSSLAALADKAQSLGGIGEAGFLQEARFALGQQGIDQDAADKALSVLNRNTGALSLGQGPLDAVLKRIDGGANLARQLKDSNDLRESYLLIVDSLNKMEDAGQRAVLATAAFGKEAGAAFGAAALEGVEGFEKLAAEARVAGLVIEDDLISRAAALDDRIDLASKRVKADLTRAFVELGPVIANLAEATANWLARISRGVADIINRARSIGQTTDIDELTGVIRTAEADIAGFNETRRQQLAQAAEGQKRGGFGFLINKDEVNRVANTLIEQADNRRIEAQEKINALIEAQGVSYDDLITSLGVVATSSEDAASSLEDFQKARNAALERLDAAKSGKGALLEFDRKAQIDALIEQAGLTGALADEARRVVKETLEANAAAEGLTKGFSAAAKAAKEIEFDPFGDLDAQNERLQSLLDAASLGQEELKSARERFEIEDKIARVKLEAAKANKTLTEDEITDLEAKLNLNRQLAEALNGREGKLANAARASAAPFAREFAHVADEFIERLARGDASAFRSLGRQLKDILFSMVLSPFKNAFANILGGLFGGGFGGGGGFSIFTPGIAGGQNPAGGGLGGLSFGGFNPASIAQTALGLGGASLGGASQIFGLASLIGPGSLGRLGAGLGNFLGLSGNLTGGLSKALSGAGTFGGALGGIGGSLLSGALFGRSTGQSIGSTIGGIAGNLIPIPVLGPLIGSFLGGALGSLFGGKPSNKFARGLFDPNTGAVSAASQKDTSEEANKNAQARDEIFAALTAGLTEIAKATGATFADKLAIEVNSRDGITVGFGGYTSKGGPANGTVFQDPEQAIKFAFDKLISGLNGGDAALVAAAKAFAASGKEVGDIVGRLSTLKEVLKDPAEIVDPLKTNIDAIVAAFEGLDVTTGALKTAFDGAIDALASRTQDALRREIAAGDNPLLVQVQDLLKAQAAQRAAVADLGAKGGSVDTSLLDEFQRRQVLNQFNIADRLAQGTDPLRFSLDQFLKTQAQELAALTAAVDGVRVRQTDVDALQRAQGLERSQFFSQLSEQDLLKLGGQEGLLDLVESFGGRIAVVLTKINDEFRRQIDEYDATLNSLRERVSTLAGQRQNFDTALFGIERDFFGGTPGQQIDSLRSTVDDLKTRALTGTDEEKAFAREQLPGAVQALLQGSERVFGRGLQFQNDLTLGKSALETVRAQIADEEALAQRQLDTLIASKDIQESMRDLLAQQTLDRAAFAALVTKLDPSNPLSAFANELISLTAAQSDQTSLIAAALTQITPKSVGFDAPVLQQADPAPSTALTATPASSATGSSVPAATTPSSAAPPAPSREVDIVNALFANYRVLQTLAAAVSAQETAQRSRDNTQTEILSQISSALKRVA